MIDVAILLTAVVVGLLLLLLLAVWHTVDGVWRRK
jgi:uncharacterized membrane protein